MNTSREIRKGIKRMPAGKIFTSAKFLSFGSRAAVDQALSRLVRNNEISRVKGGVFVKPEKNPYVGEVLPEPEKIARAIGKVSGEKVQIHGAEAVRRFGFSTQAPVLPIFYTSGPSKSFWIGGLRMEFKHAAARKLALSNRVAGQALSALWYLGKERVTTEVIEQIAKQLPPGELEALRTSKSVMPAWMASALNHFDDIQQRG